MSMSRKKRSRGGAARFSMALLFETHLLDVFPALQKASSASFATYNGGFLLQL